MSSTTDHNNDRCHRYSRSVILIMSAASIQACCSGLLCAWMKRSFEKLFQLLEFPKMPQQAAGQALAEPATTGALIYRFSLNLQLWS